MLPASTDKKSAKVVLLFVPGELVKRCAVLHLLHIRKEEGKIDYTLSAISRSDVARHFDSLAEEAKTMLLRFKPDSLAAFEKETEQRGKKQKAGISLSSFVAQSLLRQVHKQFEELKPFYHQLRCYHKICPPGTTIFQTLPCTFRTGKPQLRFDVVNNAGLFTIAVSVVIDDEVYSIGAFTRTAFFLQKENDYFLLSYKDYQTLEWLSTSLATGLEPPLFAEKILPRLEEEYTVNRNGLLNDKQVNALPQCRVYLSELNNSFLLLTPQWVYDGLLVEGPWKEEQELSLRGERIIIRRHRETEQKFLEMLSMFHPAFSTQRNGYYYLSFAEAQKKQWFIKTWYRLLEMDVEIVGIDMLHHFRYSPHKPETALTVLREEGSFVHLQIKVSFGKEAVSPPLLQKALYAGQRTIVLKDGSLGVMTDEWMAEYATIIRHGKFGNGELVVSKFLSFGEQQNATWRAPVKESWWQQWQHWQNGSEPLYPVPASVKATLRPYQQKGFEWLALLSQVGAGACLADDMGLGKTLQTITFLAWYCSQHPHQQHLIVCPTSLLYNWQQELKKFTPTIRTAVWHGTDNSVAATGATVFITTYGTLRSHSEQLLSRQFGVAVIDESHNIKNPAAQVTRIAQQVQAIVRIALSGTPVVNNTFDLYAQLNFALPGLLGTREFFKREYADGIDRLGDEGKIKALQGLTAPFILRRTKEQVATDLPSKTESILWCEMLPAQEAVYNEIKEQVRSNLFLEIENNGLQKTKLAVLHGLLKLRQVCNHPKLLPAAEHGGRLQSAKTEILMQELQLLLSEHRVLLFSQFSSMLRLLAEECDRAGITYFLLDGQTPAKKRAAMVREFQEKPTAPRLFLISLKAGNTGLTLTAADYVFLFDPWWNTAVEQQAIDRTHRIGQTKNVFSYRLICRNTVEEKILELQQRKKRLAGELIVAEKDFVKNLAHDEITYLFS
jgi:superfamily II DNA or RNA helicase